MEVGRRRTTTRVNTWREIRSHEGPLMAGTHVESGGIRDERGMIKMVLEQDSHKGEWTCGRATS